MPTNEVGEVPNALIGAAGTIPLQPGNAGLVDVSNYASGREVVGTTVLVANPQWVQIWTLEDGKRILLLGQGRNLLHWEPSLEVLESAENRALDWLTEPPVQPP